MDINELNETIEQLNTVTERSAFVLIPSIDGFDLFEVDTESARVAIGYDNLKSHRNCSHNESDGVQEKYEKGNNRIIELLNK